MTAVFNGVTNTFCYSYLPGTTLVPGMTNSAGQGWTRTYEHARNLIAAVSNSWDGIAVSSFAYENDALGRRTLRVDAAPSLSATNVFAYNQRSEVTNATMGESTYSYDYDDIGNRQASSVNAQPSSCTANSLNQYTVVTNAGIDVPVAYDLDGNMTVNGDWLYDWDGENNLWLAQQAVQTNGSLLVENSYDYLKRRWYKRVDVLTGYEPPSGSPPMPGEPGEYVPSKTTCYVWDGWNIAAEINIDEVVGTTNITRYVWGLDLSGSVQGAGGVGGLLAVIEDNGSVYFPCYDANGNITEYIDATGTVRAHREFDAFGNTTAKSGDLADSFRFWFSTKYLDVETGNYVYQQRQYIPSLGRWASRDPIGINGGKNLFEFNLNNPVSSVDHIGLLTIIFAEPILRDATQEELARGEPKSAGDHDTKFSLSCTQECPKPNYFSLVCTLSISTTIRFRPGLRTLTERWKNQRDITTEEHELNHYQVFKNVYLSSYKHMIAEYENKLCKNPEKRLEDLQQRLKKLELRLSQKEYQLEYAWSKTHPFPKDYDPKIHTEWGHAQPVLDYWGSQEIFTTGKAVACE